MAQVKAFRLGSLGNPCCPCGCPVPFTIRACTGAAGGTPVNGASITVKNLSGTTVASGTTGDTLDCSINTITKTSSGSGYSGTPTIVFTGGGGSGAAATATMSGGGVAGIVLTNRGSGYSSAPTISFSGGGTPTVPAAATCTIICGSVTLDVGSAGTYDVVVSSSAFNGTSRLALACGVRTTIGGLCALTNVCDGHAGGGIAGVTIKMSSSAGDFSADTDSNGCAVIPYPSAGTYTFSATYAGTTATWTGTAVNGGAGPCNSTSVMTVSFYYISVLVKGCIGVGIPGATVTCTGLSDQTTDSDGRARFFLAGGYTYTITAAYSRFNTATVGPQTTAVKALCGGAGDTHAITLTADTSSYVCSCLCNIPICKTLNATDSVLGGFTMTYTGASAFGGNEWQGSISASFPGCTGSPGCASTTVPVTYTFDDVTQGTPSICGANSRLSVEVAGGAFHCPVVGGGSLDTHGIGLTSTGCAPFSYVGSLSIGCTSGTCGSCGTVGTPAIWSQAGAVTMTLTISDTC